MREQGMSTRNFARDICPSKLCVLLSITQRSVEIPETNEVRGCQASSGWPRHKGNISFEPLPSEQVVLAVMLTPMSTERKTPNQCPSLHRLRLRRPPPRTTTILSRFVSYCHRVVLIADRPAYRRWCLHDDGRWASGQGCPRESVRPSRVLRCLEMSVL